MYTGMKSHVRSCVDQNATSQRTSMPLGFLLASVE